MAIRLVLTDIDGVWTDGGMYYTAAGDELKRFNTADSQGILFARSNGMDVAILTGEDTPIVRARAKKLAVTEVHLGVGDKLSLGRALCERLGVSLDEVAYIGDSLADVPLLRAVAFSGAPPNAPDYVTREVDYVTRRAGGDGAFLDFVEELLRRSGQLENTIEQFLEAFRP